MADFIFRDAWGALVILEHWYFDLRKLEVSGVCAAHVLGGGAGAGEGVGKRCRIAPVLPVEWLVGELRQRRAGRVPADCATARFEGLERSGGCPNTSAALVRDLRASLRA